METQVKKREWVKTALIIFLAVLLVLTFFSNTFLNASLPEVAAVQVTSGTVNAKIRGQGTVQANEAYEVTINQTRTIASVMVKTGQSVSVGDTLFVLEQTESDELKTAQDELDQLEQAYEKALISAGNDAATKNHDVQKAQEAYNEAVAVYQQYSTVSATQLAKEQAAAEAKLKELQKISKQAEEAYTEASSDSEYTEAQAQVTASKGEITSLEAEIEGYQQQIKDLDSGSSEKESLRRQIQDKQREIDDANATIRSDEFLYRADYDDLMTISGNEKSKAAGYAKDTDFLAEELAKNHGYNNNSSSSSGEGGTVIVGDSEAQKRAKELSLAFTTLEKDYGALETLKIEMQRLEKDLSNVDDNAEASRQKILDKLYTAQDKLGEAERTLSKAEDTVSKWEKTLKRMKEEKDTASDAATAQQEAVDKLTTAASAADTVKSTKQALEDLLFNQSLGDTNSVDMKAQKEQIEKKREEISKLEDNSDELEVKSKVNGTVKEINVSAGKSVGKDMPLCSINVTDRGFTVQISVTNDQAKKVKVGDPAELVNYWGGDLKATLESITNDPQNPGKSKLLVFRLDGEVDADQTLTLSIGQKSANYDALVPNAAVRSDSNGSFVLVLVAKSTPLGNRYTATRADVQVLAKDDSSSAVTGLSYSDFVITTSTKPIEAGTQVRLADQG